MLGIIVWGSIILINVIIFLIICRPRNWADVKLLKILLAAFISDILVHIILVAKEYECKEEYLMWLPISFPIVLAMGALSIIVVKTLYISIIKRNK